MKAVVLNSKVILTVFFVVACLVVKSQNQKNVEDINAKNSITLKFPNYTYEMDCKVMEIINQIKDAKVVFTCVAAGILVIESDKMVGTNFKDILNNKIQERNETIKFELIELVTSTANGNNIINAN